MKVKRIRLVNKFIKQCMESLQRVSQMQCGKPFFPNTRENGECTVTITRQDEKELAMFGE
jgi:hypothetical protein